MLPSLLVAATIVAAAAPTPKDTCPNPSRPAPRILAARANAGGDVQVAAMVYDRRKVQISVVVVENGKQVKKTQEQEITTSTYLIRNLEDFGKFSTVDGTPLTPDQAVRRVKAGALILVPSDNGPIEPAWLNAFTGDVVVLHSDELAHAHFLHGQPDQPTTAAPRLVMLGSDGQGMVRLAVNPAVANGGQMYDEFENFQNGAVRVVQGGAGRLVFVNGNFMPIHGDEAVAPGIKPAGLDGKKPLADLLFEAHDLTGRRVPRADALKRMKGGGLVLFAGDNRLPDPGYLKAFHQDLLVLVSPELVFPPGQPNPYDPPTKKSLANTGPASAVRVQVVRPGRAPRGRRPLKVL